MAVIPRSPTLAIETEVRVFQFAGSPVNGTSGTFHGIAAPGALLVDITGTQLYINTNTQASPTWAQIAHA